MASGALSSRQRACVLRALHSAHEALVSERERLVLLNASMSIQERHRLLEVETEMDCLSSAINWFWRQL